MRAPLLEKANFEIGVMSFLAQNILRVGERIFVVYGAEGVELPESWSQDSGRFAKQNDSLSLGEMKEKFFRKPKGQEGASWAS